MRATTNVYRLKLAERARNEANQCQDALRVIVRNLMEQGIDITSLSETQHALLNEYFTTKNRLTEVIDKIQIIENTERNYEVRATEENSFETYDKLEKLIAEEKRMEQKFAEEKANNEKRAEENKQDEANEYDGGLTR